MTLRSLFICCWLGVAACAAAAADTYDEINRLRAGEGRCSAPARLPQLRRHPALEQAARQLSRGNTLERSLAAAGYRATRATFFSMSGDGVEYRAAEMIASRIDCKQVM